MLGFHVVLALARLRIKFRFPLVSVFVFGHCVLAELGIKIDKTGELRSPISGNILVCCFLIAFSFFCSISP